MSLWHVSAYSTILRVNAFFDTEAFESENNTQVFYSLLRSLWLGVTIYRGHILVNVNPFLLMPPENPKLGREGATTWKAGTPIPPPSNGNILVISMNDPGPRRNQSPQAKWHMRVGSKSWTNIQPWENNSGIAPSISLCWCTTNNHYILAASTAPSMSRQRSLWWAHLLQWTSISPNPSTSICVLNWGSSFIDDSALPQSNPSFQYATNRFISATGAPNCQSSEFWSLSWSGNRMLERRVERSLSASSGTEIWYGCGAMIVLLDMDGVMFIYVQLLA